MNQRKPVKVGSVPEMIRTIGAELDGGTIPDLYVTDGRLSLIEHVSGTANQEAGDHDRPLPVTSATLSPARLALALAQHACVYRVSNKDGSETEITPPAPALSAILAGRTWPGVPPLRGIVGAPVLRADGTLMQQPGYDARTGLYLAPSVQMRPVPDEPTPDDVADARAFLLDAFLGDFPWIHDADTANYIALAVTPILRRYLGSPVPFGIITATMPSSGKSILTTGLGLLYGLKSMPWPDGDIELRKAITSALTTVEGTMMFDNLSEGTVINSAVLANLITSNMWSDRLLGGNKIASLPNDRLWLANGNNLSTGGDMASRSVWVRLDPQMARPEERDSEKFKLGDLTEWIEKPEHREQLLRCLLVLVLDWTHAGAKRAKVRGMRQFTPWAEGVGGFLAHHGIPGFLGNAEEARSEDADDAEWCGFLAKWHNKFGGAGKRAAEVRDSADDDLGHDAWSGMFITTPEGRTPNAKRLGAMLRGQIGRFHGPYVLRKSEDPHTKTALWKVERSADA